jgi:LysR family hydrogen peroxide-inducible transcriptional activator
VIEDITPALLERLHQGDIDMVIAALPIPGSELASLVLFEERFYAVLPERHAMAKRKEICLSDLDREPFLLLKEGHCFRDSLIAACRQSKVKPAVAFESGQFATILAMVASGMGVSAVPAMAVQPQPGCRFIPITGKRSTRKVGIVTLRHHYAARAQRIFMNQMLHTCGAPTQRTKPTPE